MAEFSQASTIKLATCHPELILLFNEVIKFRDCTVLVGHRGEAEQNAAFAAGKSKLQWPHGKHNSTPSMAVDVAPWPLPDWDKIIDFIYFGGYVRGVAEMLREQGKMTFWLRYGGDFRGNELPSTQSFMDAVHFELVA